MSTTRTFVSLVLFTAVTAAAPRTVRAATPAAADPPATTTTAAAAQDDGDDDAAFTPAEPDFRLINLPTTLRLPLFKGNFDLTHRFGGNLRRGSFGDQASSLFGIDSGAVVGFEYRMAVARHVEAAIFRTAFDRTIQFYGKYDAVHQHASMPLSVSGIVSIEGTNNFGASKGDHHYAPALGLTVSRTVANTVALYVVPTWVHNTAASLNVDRDTFFVGVGGRLKIRPTVYVAAEVSPRASGYAPGKAEYGFAIEKRAGGHMFQLNFTNGSATTFAQIARGGVPDNLTLGFNLARKFF